jgi:hypothetical protein
MGILLLPIAVGILFIFFKTSIDLVKKIRAGKLNYLAIFLSPCVSGTLYLGLILYWKVIKRVYVFEPFFLIPLICLGIPFLMSHFIDKGKVEDGGFLSDLMKFSIIISIVILIVFNGLLFDIERLIGVETYH